jgi:hypothetical protein
MKFWQTLQATALLTLSLANSESTQAHTESQLYGDILTRQHQTLYVRADYEWNTFQSEAIDSNATSGTRAVSIGTYAGTSRHFGISLNMADTSMAFPLNDSRIDAAFYDVTLQSRFYWLYPSLSAHLNEMTFNRSGEEIADFYATGYAVGLALRVPATDRILFEAEGRQVFISRTKEQEGRFAELNPMQNFSVGANIDILPRYLDGVFGYKMRRFALELEDGKYQQAQSAPFVGLQAGFYF